MMAEAEASSARTALWVAATLLGWPLWHWLWLTLAAYPLSWLASLSSASLEQPSDPGGIYGATHAGMFAAAGFALGFLGMRVLRGLGAPTFVWLVASAVSMTMYLATAIFWAGFSGFGTGALHITIQLAVSAALGASVGVGAWLGARRPERG